MSEILISTIVEIFLVVLTCISINFFKSIYNSRNFFSRIDPLCPKGRRKNTVFYEIRKGTI